MVKYNNADINGWYFDESDIIKVYRNNVVCYYKVINSGGTPTGSTCSEIIPYSISAYSSTTYDSVYSYTDGKWYMLNNLNDYEEYGIYETGSSLSSFTYYPNKLVIVGTTEYQRSGDTWVEVGTYESSETSYPINDSNLDDYVGMELSTTFKIPVADADALGGFLNFGISTSDGGNLDISTYQYFYFGNDFEEGTVTNDGTYYNYSLPTTESITIRRIDYWYSETIHIIVGGMAASVEYSAKTTPSSALTYSSVAEMEAVECPTVGVGQYCYTNGQTYKFTSNEEWVTVQDSEIMMRASDGSGNTRILACGYNDGAIPNKIAFDLNAVEAYFGPCVTSIGTQPFGGMYDNLESVTVTSVIPPDIDISNFEADKVRIYVPCNSVHAYRTAKGWKSYANVIDSFEPNCQQTDYKVRFYDANDNLIGELQKSTAYTGSNITSAETQQYASSTYRVEVGDSFVRIQEGAFKGFTHITSLSIGNNVLFINSNLVSGCTSLQTLELPSEYNAYLNANLITYCNSLQSITIPSGTTAIYRNSINNCANLQSITILKPNGVLSFWSNSGTVFENTNNCPIYVPSNLVNTYKSASGWSTVASRIQAIP